MGTEIINKAKTAVANGANPTVEIYFLDNANDTNFQRLIIVKPSTPPSEEDEKEPGKTTVLGKVTISGYVWEDISPSKSNVTNGEYQNGDGDIKVSGIPVTWKSTDGTVLGETTTGADGSYKFETELELWNHPYGIKDTNKYNQINNSFIEFKYNGLKYTTVAYNGELTSDNTSKGIELTDTRESLDNKFDKVENKAVYDGNSVFISGIDRPEVRKDCLDSNYKSEFSVGASTENVVSNLLGISEQNKWVETKKFCTDHCPVGGHHSIKIKIDSKKNVVVGQIPIYENNPPLPGEQPIRYDDIKKDVVLYMTKYCYKDSNESDLSDEKKYFDNLSKYDYSRLKGEDFNKFKLNAYYPADEIDGPTNKDCLDSSDKIWKWDIKNVNLGLTKREQADAAMSLYSDIEKVRVIMKGQEYTYIYGERGNQDIDPDYKVQWGDKYTTEFYSRPVNPADIAYINDPDNSNELKVYVTYDIRVANESKTLPMKINRIDNYYDSRYTIYKGNGTATTNGWQETNQTKAGMNGKENAVYKVAYNPEVNITLQPGEVSKKDLVKIEFEVNPDTVKGLIDSNEALMQDFSEITSFTTYYGAETMCAERQTAGQKGKTGNQYASLDKDSTPGNYERPGTEEGYEDDTTRLPGFKLYVNDKYKTVSGVVYEDTQTEKSKKDRERLGNGIKEGNENGVENVRVELIDPDTGELAELYYIDENTHESKTELAVTYTNQNGEFTIGNTDNRGLVVDNYIIKYTYGDAEKGVDVNGRTIGETKINGNTINARNYKSTIIVNENLKKVMHGDSLDQNLDKDKWHLYMKDEQKDLSVAVDNLNERLEIESLKYDRYDNKINMSAYSKPFKLQVEYTKDAITDVDKDGGDFEKDISTLDFGIIERPRENIIINKTISRIRVTLANGQELIDGDPRSQSLKYVKPIGFKEQMVAEYNAISKRLSMEIDSELLQGATLEVWYTIMLTNNSEVDYEYEDTYNDIIVPPNTPCNFITKKDKANYYYYGDKNGTDILKNSAELVVDYMPSKLVCHVGDDFKTEGVKGSEDVNNKDWHRYEYKNNPEGNDDKNILIDGDYLKNNGYISETVAETVKNRKLQTIISDTFANVGPGETKKSVIYASTLLANQEEDSVIDNSVEIIEINGKMARTIKETGTDGSQVEKEYQPGNYIPSLDNEVHQQDDEKVTITITKPTGTTNYITIYVIAATIGLIVIAGGIVLIKKKVINK